MPVKLEDQVCSLESAKRLKELGCFQDSLFYWEENSRPRNARTDTELPAILMYFGYKKKIPIGKLIYSAYTVAELGELLPKCYQTIHRLNEEWECTQRCLSCGEGDLYAEYEPNGVVFFEKTEAEARAKMLIYLAENNLIESKGRNGEEV